MEDTLRVLVAALSLLVVAACSGAQPSAKTDITYPYDKFVAHVKAANLPEDAAYELGWTVGIKPQPCYEAAFLAYKDAIIALDNDGTPLDLSQVLAKSTC